MSRSVGTVKGSSARGNSVISASLSWVLNIGYSVSINMEQRQRTMVTAFPVLPSGQEWLRGRTAGPATLSRASRDRTRSDRLDRTGDCRRAGRRGAVDESAGTAAGFRHRHLV